MVYTVCIKTNNAQVLDYLLTNVKKENQKNIVISENKFKIYKNVIFHNIKDNPFSFYLLISKVLANCIINFYETSLVRKIIYSNYFYFSDSEKKIILKNCIKDLSAEDKFLEKINIISNHITDYFKFNNQMVLDGFINFRLQKYINLLDNQVDLSVDKFLVEREYNEFINLLKIYIDSKPSISNIIHIIYINETAILLDENKKIIDTKSSMVNAKYLSDITFSSNDYALNTLLTFLPKNIKIHSVNKKDEFINTLDLIFGDRIIYCNGCSLCKEIYKTRKEISYD